MSEFSLFRHLKTSPEIIFQAMRGLQKFAAVHASVPNPSNRERSLSRWIIFQLNRAAAIAEWRGLGVV